MRASTQSSRRLLGWWLGGCLLATASVGFGPREAGAQTPADSQFHAYPLRQAAPEEVEERLRQLLSDAGQQAEVIADRKGNRLLVRGNRAAQQLARQVVDSLDQPAKAAPVAAEPQFKAYEVAPDELEVTVSRLQRQFGAAKGTRITADARTSQILVLAAPDIQAKVARSLPTSRAELPAAKQPTRAAAPRPRVAQAQQPNKSQPNRQAQYTQPQQPTKAAAGKAQSSSYRLQNVTPEQFETTLNRLSRKPLGATVDRGGTSVTYHLPAAAGKNIDMAVDRHAGNVTLWGTSDLVTAWMLLVRAIDAGNRQDADTTAVAYQKSQQPALQKALAAFQPRAGERDAQSQNVQPRDNQVRDSQPLDGDDPDAPPAEQGLPPENPDNRAAQNPVGGAMIGPVQIEFLEGLDVIVVRGHPRDVQRVTEIINDIERLSVDTEPSIEIVPLKHVSSEALGALIRQIYEQVLSTRQGRVSITELVKPNALLLIGRDESVKTVKALIRKLDQPVGPQSQFKVFPIRHTSAAAAQSLVQEFFANRTGLGAKVLATADVRSNLLIVQASPRDLAEVEALIKRIDTATSAAVNEMRIFPLQNSLADELAPVLQSAVNGDAASTRRTTPNLGGQQPGGGGQGGPAPTGGATAPQTRSTMLRLLTLDAQGERKLRSGILTDVKVTADSRANALIVTAPAESMELLAALIKQLDQLPTAEAQLKVFTIVNGDASNLAEMLRTLFGRAQTPGQNGGGAFGGQGGGGAVLGGVAQGENSLVPLRFSVDQRTNSIVVSGAAGDLNVVEAILLRLDDSDVRQRKSVVYRLKNAPALDVSNAVNEFLRSQRQVQNISPGLLSPFEQIEREVIVVPEPVSNSLIVSATPRYFDEIRKVVEQLDARPPMVMIQVLIAEISLNNTDEFGVELGLQDSVLFDRSLLGNLVQNTTTTTFGNPPTTVQQNQILGASNTPGFDFNNQPLGNSGSDKSLSTAGSTGSQALSNFSVGRVNNELGFGGLVLSASSESVSVLLRALQECRRLDVLSRPQVMTLDNQPAFVQVGQRVPFITGSSITTTGQINNITFENVGLILGVTPRISPDGLVVMEIDATRSEVGPEAEGIPVSVSNTGNVVRSPRINITTAQTTVSALSGQTVVLGGLIVSNKRQTHRRVPLLSDIPLLGNLFRYDNVTNSRSELLIIMTPRVVRTEQDAEVIKQVEAARMTWCLADVIRLHGESGLRTRRDEWLNDETATIYPDIDPSGAIIHIKPEEIPTPAKAKDAPTGPNLIPPTEVPSKTPMQKPNYLPETKQQSRLPQAQPMQASPLQGQPVQRAGGPTPAATGGVERAVYQGDQAPQQLPIQQAPNPLPPNQPQPGQPLTAQQLQFQQYQQEQLRIQQAQQQLKAYQQQQQQQQQQNGQRLPQAGPQR